MSISWPTNVENVRFDFDRIFFLFGVLYLINYNLGNINLDSETILPILSPSILYKWSSGFGQTSFGNFRILKTTIFIHSAIKSYRCFIMMYCEFCSEIMDTYSTKIRTLDEEAIVFNYEEIRVEICLLEKKFRYPYKKMRMNYYPPCPRLIYKCSPKQGMR
jgi:hypothetical protein